MASTVSMFIRVTLFLGRCAVVLLLILACWYWAESLLGPAFILCHFALAFLGILVAVTTIFKNRTWFVVVLFIVLASGAIVLEKVESRLERTQADLEKASEKEAIRAEFRVLMEQAKSIERAVSAAKPQPRAYIETMPSLAAFSIGQRLAVNGDFKNVGPDPAHDFGHRMKMYVVSTAPLGSAGEQLVPRDVQNEKFADFEREFPNITGRSTIGPGPSYSRFNTTLGPILDEQLFSELMSGSKALLYVAKIVWKDGYGPHERELCTWLQPGFDKKEIWQLCKDHTSQRY